MRVRYFINMVISSFVSFNDQISTGSLVMKNIAEMKYIQCFHDCPIMESSSTFILLSFSTEV